MDEISYGIAFGNGEIPESGVVIASSGNRKDAKWEAKHKYPADDKAPVELYNYAKDPEQRNNIASSHPEVVERLQKQLKKPTSKATPPHA